MNINVAIKIKKGINFKKNSLEVLIREIAPQQNILLILIIRVVSFYNRL